MPGDWVIVLERVSLECLKVAFANEALCNLLTARQLKDIIVNDVAKQKEALQYPYIFSKFSKLEFYSLKPNAIVNSKPYKSLPLSEQEDLRLFLGSVASSKCQMGA